MGAETFETYMRDRRKSKNTIDSYLRDIRLFSNYLKGKDIAKADAYDIEQCMERMSQRGRSKASINRFLAAVRHYYEYLKNTGQICTNPASKVQHIKAELPEPKILTAKEIDELLSQPARDEIGRRDRAMLEILYATGMRVSDLLALNVDRVNLRGKCVSCPDRIIPLHDVAVRTVQEWLDVRGTMASAGEQALFVNKDGVRMSRQGFWKRIKKYATGAGIKKEVSPHVLRHSFAVHLLQNGAGTETVRRFMGHADISSTKRYNGLVQSLFRREYMQAHPRAKK